MYCSGKIIDELIVCRCLCALLYVCVSVICMCAYLGDDGILCEIKGNTAANIVQIDVKLYLNLALSFSLSQ